MNKFSAGDLFSIEGSREFSMELWKEVYKLRIVNNLQFILTWYLFFS